MGGELTLEQHPLLSDRGGEAILEPTESGRGQRFSVRGVDWRQGVGMLLILAGVVGVIAAWIGVSGTFITSDQLSYLTSGGLGGVAAIGIGVVLLVSYEHSCDRKALQELATRIQILEEALAAEFTHRRERR